jgi:hypothetical protein
MTEFHEGGGQNEIAFEAIDAEIFRIPDEKTRLNTLQSYFFPRLERLVKRLVEKGRAVYDIDPLEDMTFAYRPAHRKDAANVKDYAEVYIGLTPGKSSDALQVFHEDGTPFLYSPSFLVVVVNPAGALRMSFRPYWYKVDAQFRRHLHAAVTECWDLLGPVMEMARIAPVAPQCWTPLRDTLLGSCRWDSPLLHFPLSESMWLGLSNLPFLALFPLLDTGARLARDRQVRLRALVEKFQRWVEEFPEDQERSGRAGAGGEQEVFPSIVLPDLDSYRMIRAGKWYQILARDNFTCRTCGRSAQKDGVVLHVDHIKPRSKGGTDDPSNLQTLCLKCNIGKSDTDEPSTGRMEEKGAGWSG